MKRNLLLEYSEQLAVKIVKLCAEYKIDANTVFQIKKSSSSVFANISEAQYPQSLSDMLSKFEIARKECVEIESWLKLMFPSGSIEDATFKKQKSMRENKKNVNLFLHYNRKQNEAGLNILLFVFSGVSFCPIMFGVSAGTVRVGSRSLFHFHIRQSCKAAFFI